MSEEADSASDVFTAEQQHTLAAVLDEIIPPSRERALPGAGEAGCVAALARTTGAQPGLAELLVQGAEAADTLARERGADCFAELPREQRRALLDDLAPTQPSFVGSLVFHGYTSYYVTQPVVEALGLEYRPPHPKGYELKPFDASLLEPVKARGKIYRDV